MYRFLQKWPEIGTVPIVKESKEEKFFCPVKHCFGYSLNIKQFGCGLRKICNAGNS